MRQGDERGGIRTSDVVVSQLAPPRTVWVMVPHGAPTRTTIEELLPLLAPEDVVIDGGNSRYTDSVAHAARCREHGVLSRRRRERRRAGLAEGFNLMIGGPRERRAYRGTENARSPLDRRSGPPQGGTPLRISH